MDKESRFSVVETIVCACIIIVLVKLMWKFLNYVYHNETNRTDCDPENITTPNGNSMTDNKFKFKQGMLTFYFP